MVISPPEFRADEQSIVQEMLDAGLKCYHIRKPDFSEEDLREYILRFEADYRGRLIIHHRPDLMVEFDLGGVHYRFSDLNIENSADGKIISCSCHSWEEVQNLPSDLNYAFVSPVFDSISKEGYERNTALLSVPSFDKACPLIALGGIDKNNFERAFDAGYDGVAFLGYIWQQEGSEIERFERIQEKIIGSKIHAINQN